MRSDDLYMFVDCLTNNPDAPSGHKHNSRLSFELFAYDKTFIIDPGTYVYSADPKWRNKFRSTEYHNTAVVDQEEQNVFEEHRLFRMGSDANVKINNWDSNENYDFLDAEHTGYDRLDEPITHRRQIWFNKDDGYWIIRDIFLGNDDNNSQNLISKHDYEIYFHFAPMKISIEPQSAIKSNNTEGANIVLVPIKNNDLETSIEDGWVSYGYGSKIKAQLAKYSLKGGLGSEFMIALYPYIETQFSYKEALEKISLDDFFACANFPISD